ncbi:hypothetical protein Clacol_000993 [Clathrus columnatus]|uniref:Uncharacterized protein n=1 Tax=Clathrus columnatus TaxID=1419009 RepID=A0AAV4ZXH5_9AGAM|nr:hypothetical protein Clacol_000993 [Clathrus columnatus]
MLIIGNKDHKKLIVIIGTIRVPLVILVIQPRLQHQCRIQATIVGEQTTTLPTGSLNPVTLVRIRRTTIGPPGRILLTKGGANQQQVLLVLQNDNVDWRTTFASIVEQEVILDQAETIKVVVMLQDQTTIDLTTTLRLRHL